MAATVLTPVVGARPPVVRYRCHSLVGHSRLTSPLMRRALMISLLVLAALVTAPPGANATSLTWRPTLTGTDAQFRGLSAVSKNVAWVSGQRGTVLRTVD